MSATSVSAVVFLSTGETGGLIKLLERFDVIPTYVSKKEIKILFQLLVQA